MTLVTLISIAAEVLQVAAAMARDGRQQATAREVAQIRGVTQTDIGLIEQDINPSPPPSSE